MFGFCMIVQRTSALFMHMLTVYDAVPSVQCTLCMYARPAHDDLAARHGRRARLPAIEEASCDRVRAAVATLCTRARHARMHAPARCRADMGFSPGANLVDEEDPRVHACDVPQMHYGLCA